jgi:hypothetical protein
VVTCLKWSKWETAQATGNKIRYLGDIAGGFLVRYDRNEGDPICELIPHGVLRLIAGAWGWMSWRIRWFAMTGVDFTTSPYSLSLPKTPFPLNQLSLNSRSL